MRPLLAALLASAAFAAVLSPREASACAVFTPPNGNAPVTDHKLIYSVSKKGSVLYDQVKYTGTPSGFAWVLPVKGTVDVGLSSDALFEVLDGETASKVEAPIVPGCRPIPEPVENGGQRGGGIDAGFGGTDGVTVKEMETVGPYDVVQLSATDGSALTNWLTANGFAIPQDVAPLFADYISQQFDFVAMKLTPKAGVELMRPVRITMNGAMLQMPVRPIAAGTGVAVGITLYVVSEGYYEPKNFPFFKVTADELTWDFAAKQSDFELLRRQRANALAGGGFELESQTTVEPWRIAQGIRYSPSYRPGPNEPPPTVDPVQEEMEALAGSIPGSLHVSRLRGDLVRAALGKDLDLQPSASQSGFGPNRLPTKYANVPATCPPGFEPGTNDPSAGALGGGCAVGAAGSSGSGLATLGLVGLAAVIARRVRRRHDVRR